MTVRSLERDFGRAALALIVLVTVGFAVAAVGHLRQSVGWYMTLARAHVWFELAVFAYFVGRAEPAPASRVKETPRATRRYAAPLLLAAAPVAVSALSGCASPCQEIELVSETSHGSFSYASTSASSEGASMNHGSLPEAALTMEGCGPSAVTVNGSFDDSLGGSHTFTLYVTGVTSHATSALGPGSMVCIDSAEPQFADGGFADPTSDGACPPLEGTVTASTFATDCQTSSGCTLSLVGELTATATLPDGTFSVDLDLEHQDLRRNIACPVSTSSSYGDGTPGS
jgi:hypothetical protein